VRQSPVASAKVRVAERDDLRLDSRPQRTQQETQFDPNLKIVLSHGHRAERAGSLEVAIALGLRQSQIVLPADDDGRHRLHSIVPSSVAIQRFLKI
jgi:hypothetical protein